MIGTSIIEVNMNKISTGTSQARQRDIEVTKDDDLVISIEKNGLLSPIIVKRINGENFEVVVGQRRFLAHKVLGKPTIKACILEGDVSELAAKRISLIENLARKDMKHADYVDTVQWFMNQYNNTNTVAEELGISPITVRKYLTIGRLPNEIKNDIEQNKYRAAHALKALDALGGDETTVDVDNLRETSMLIKELSPQARKKFAEIKRHEPGASSKDVAEKAKRRIELHKFTVDIATDQYERIGAFQDREKIETPQRAAIELIDLGLEAADV